ncbi:PREDICTED: proline-rich protein PRCC-like isoform X2 [Priapulus caudatus]|uniref:Proline-rich protein PRCC-like isoform X2 n=1 Tax=Priapulus caudatus TaxID=37621 RepID=A0ABM1ETL1_PRICU|nr:PREDICTED: proline-rich protein PRCC-like isoform X2 [Priapulus caudatus]
MDDSDEDESSKEKKKPAVVGGGTGLFALLPQPKHAVTKETNRLLLPFSLTRKVSEKPKVAATNPFAQKKAPVISSVVDEVESDSDEGVGNFFSLDQVSEQKVLPKVGMEPYVVGDVAHSAPVTAPPHGSIVSHGESGSALVATTAASSATSGGEDSHANPIRIDDAKTTVYEASADSMDEPLKFGSGASTWSSRQYTQIHGGRQFGYGSQNAGQYMDHVSSQPIGQYKYTDQGSGPAYNDPYSSSVGTHGIQSNEQYTYSVQGGYDYNEVQSTSSVKQPGYSLEAGQSLSHLVQDEKFLKIQGVKQRGKEEINFIDVNADDELGHMDNHLIKGLSEETEHRSKRKKEEMPSAQQKRKHQLKYLAFQAKERELELKNAWAQGRANRKTAQSKYGF